MIRPLVVVPSKDNAATISEVVQRCRDHADRVLVIDDGCTDATAELAAAAGATVVHHAHNRGKGAALDTALRWAQREGYTHMVCLDADGQHFPDDLPAFFQAIEQHPDAIIAGCRDLSTAPGSSQFGRRFSNFWVWLETGWTVADSQCGFRAYPVEAVLELGLRPGRYEWEVEVLVRALWAGVEVRDLPCQVFYPPKEERVSSFDPLWDNVRISLLNTRLVLTLLLWPPLWVRRVLPRRRWKGTHRGPAWGWTFFLYVLRLFGRWPTYAGMTVLTSFYFVFAGVNRRNVVAYLGLVQPGRGVAARLVDTWRLFLNFSVAIVDRFVLMLKGPSAFELVHDYEPGVLDLRDQGTGFFVFTAHLGNADLGAVALREAIGDRKVHLLLYAADGDSYVRLLRQTRGAAAPEIIPLNKGGDFAALAALRAIRAGGVVAIKADRVVDDRQVMVPVLGRPMALPTGPFQLAALTKAPVIWLGCFKQGASTYRVTATAPRVYRFSSRDARDHEVEGWVAEFGAQLDQWARAYPLQWYNFHDAWAPPEV